jgi:hypothetical protein
VAINRGGLCSVRLNNCQRAAVKHAYVHIRYQVIAQDSCALYWVVCGGVLAQTLSCGSSLSLSLSHRQRVVAAESSDSLG